MLKFSHLFNAIPIIHYKACNMAASEAEQVVALSSNSLDQSHYTKCIMRNVL